MSPSLAGRCLKGIGLVLLAALLCACRSNGSRMEVVEAQGFACGAGQPEGVRLLGREALPPTDGALKVEPSPSSGQEPPFDHERFWLVRVDMGCQPSGGYGLRLLSDKLELVGDRARLALAWEKPAPDKMQIQMITCPCRHLGIAKGEYKRLEIVDQEGMVRYRLELP